MLKEFMLGGTSSIISTMLCSSGVKILNRLNYLYVFFCFVCLLVFFVCVFFQDENLNFVSIRKNAKNNTRICLGMYTIKTKT